MATVQHFRFGVLLGSLSLAALVAAGGTAQAQVQGFGAGFTLNGGATVSSGSIFGSTVAGYTLNLTDAGGGQARSAFYGTKQDITAFTSNFVYQASGNKSADGVAFVLQNDTRGTAALGGTGGFLGYGGGAGTAITPSAAVELNLYTGNNLTQGGGFATNGGVGAYSTTGSVNISSGDPIDVFLNYNGSVLSETLTDMTTALSFTTSYTTNLTSVLGSGTAYVGFTGGDGGATAIQTISNFSFSKQTYTVTKPTDTVTAYAPAGNSPTTGQPNSAPGAEGPSFAIDGTASKYLNFYGAGSGIVVTPSGGASTLKAINFVAANDSVDRDPTTFTLEGSNNGGTTYTTIVANQPINLGAGRNQGGIPLVGADSDLETFFTNNASYTSYRVTFPTLKNTGSVNNYMQIGEIQFEAFAPEPGSVALAASALLPVAGLALRRRRKA